MSEDFSPKKAGGLWYKILNETPYTIGAVASGGLALLTMVAFVTSLDLGSSIGGTSTDFSDNNGQNSSRSAFANTRDNTGLMSTYIAKMRASSGSNAQSVDSTRLLMSGEDIPLNMAYSGLKGKTGGKEKFVGDKVTLAQMGEIQKGGGGTGAQAAAGKDAAKTVVGDAPAAAKKSGGKLSRFQQIKRSLAGGSGGDSIFAGFESFMGFGNKDGKKSAGGVRTTGSDGDAKRDKYGRQSAAGHGKKGSRWSDPYRDAGNDETGEGLTGMEGAFTNARQGADEARGALLGGDAGGVDNVGTGGNQFNPPGGGGPGAGGDNGTQVEGGELQGEAAAAAAAAAEETPAEDFTPNPEEYVPPPLDLTEGTLGYSKCKIIQKRDDCGNMNDWVKAEQDAIKNYVASNGEPTSHQECMRVYNSFSYCGNNPTAWETKYGTGETASVGGDPTDFCSTGCLLMHESGENYVDVTSCPSGYREVVINLPYMGNKACFKSKVSDPKKYQDIYAPNTSGKKNYITYVPLSAADCKTGNLGTYPSGPVAGQYYCKDGLR